jgi:mono/diheme cytochrome c family protein
LKPFRSLSLIALFAMCAPFSIASDTGKALYDNSCITCHGSSGEGNPVMDKFYRMRIPRLNANYVQSKSDAELTKVILNGKRKMPPAMDGLPETQHRSKIEAGQVPGLVVFLRTLKEK